MLRILGSYCVSFWLLVVGTGLVAIGYVGCQICAMAGRSTAFPWFLAFLGIVLLASLLFKAVKSIGWV
jgi:hypothetical protein